MPFPLHQSKLWKRITEIKMGFFCFMGVFKMVFPELVPISLSLISVRAMKALPSTSVVSAQLVCNILTLKIGLMCLIIRHS